MGIVVILFVYLSALQSSSDTCFANIFFHPVSCLFFFLITSVGAEVTNVDEIQITNEEVVECKTVQRLWKIPSRHFLKKLSVHLSYSPTIAVLSIYPGETIAYVHVKTCT